MADEKKKIVKASDATILRRLAKKLFGKPMSDLTNAELKKIADGAYFSDANVTLKQREAAARKIYQDKILRDDTELGGKYGSRVGKKAREARAGVENMMKKVREYKKKNKGANDMRMGGMVLSTRDNRKKK